MTRLRLSFALLAATGLLLAGCGSDEEGDATTTVVEETDGGKEVRVTSSGGAVFDAQSVFDTAAPSVVTIRSIFPGSSGSLEGQGAQAGQGSGFVISEEGEIVTNAHVVTDGDALLPGDEDAPDLNEAREVFVEFPDRNQVEAEIVGFDPFADVALLKIDPDGLELDPIELGSIEEVGVGEPVATIGSPFGERQSLSVGVVSQTDRSIPSLTRFFIEGAIQTDASINPGNSGGPMVDVEGRVIGINQQIDTTSGGNQGVGFAVPIDLAKRSIDQLRDKGEVEYAYIGVETTALYPQLADELEIDADSGALVANVIEGGPADDAELCCSLSPSEQDESSINFQGQPGIVTGGDVIVAVDGEKIVSASDLPRIVSLKDPGEEITLEIIRDGERQELDVTLGTRPT